MQQVENELDQAQEQLSAANTKLEEKEKALQNVSSRPWAMPQQQSPPPPLLPPQRLFTLFIYFVCVNLVGRGGGSQPSEADAAAGERPRPGAGVAAQG